MAILWITGTAGPEEPVAVAYSEKETYSADGATASVQLRCPWEDRYLVVDNISEALLEWPYSPAGNLLLATGADIEAAPSSQTGRDGSGNTYKEAIITVQFQREAGNEGGPGATGEAIYYETTEVNAEMQKLDPKGPDGKTQVYYWGTPALAGNAVTEEEAPTRLVIGLDYVVRWSKLKVIPSAAFTLTGCVNNAPVISPSMGFTFPTETLLYNPPRISRAVTRKPAENKFEMECRFSYRKGGWNKYWRAKTEQYEEIYKYDPGEDPPGTTLHKNYPLGNFAGVLP